MGPRCPIPLHVVILYGEVTLGSRALRLLAELGRQLEIDVRFEPQLWQLGLMEKRSWREAIAPELAAADVVILAPCAGGLAAAMEDWFVASVECPGNHAPAVIGLGAWEDETWDESATDSWARLQQRIGPRFFVARTALG